MKYNLLLIIFLFINTCRSDALNGHKLWKSWFTSDSILSIWDNFDQIMMEKNDPQSKQIHDYLKATKWDVSEFIKNKPDNQDFVIVETGSKAKCAPSCYRVVFGVTTTVDQDVKLVAYQTNDQVDELLVKLHKNDGNMKSQDLDYSNLESNGVEILYKLNGDSFVGQGEMILPDGKKLTVKETINQEFVKHLETVFDKQGNPITKDIIPFEYRLVEKNPSKFLSE